MQVETYEQIADEDFQRSVAWRYERALSVLDNHGGRWDRVRDDQLTKDCVRYLSSRRELLQRDVDPESMHLILRGRYKTIHEAFRRWELPPTEWDKYVLEAYILSGASDVAVARQLVIKPEIVDVYERLFFRVRDRLSLTSYIAGKVIGKVFQNGLAAYNPELLLKYFGYFLGETAVRIFMAAFDTAKRFSSDAELFSYFDIHARRAWKIQAVTTSTMIQPTKFDVRTVWEGYLKLVELDNRPNDGNRAGQWIESLMKYMAAKTPIPRGSEAEVENLGDSPLRNYSVGCVELRADEQIRLASSGGLPYYQQLADFKVPQRE